MADDGGAKAEFLRVPGWNDSGGESLKVSATPMRKGRR
jgi:hypothetical protein